MSPWLASRWAQANLDGGGNTDQKRRASSPFPVMEQRESAPELKQAQSRVQQLEREATELMTRLKSQAAVARYERNRTVPDLRTLARLVEACGLELRLSIAEPDPHDRDLIHDNLRRTPAQRATANRNATRILAAAARARADGRVRPLFDA